MQLLGDDVGNSAPHRIVEDILVDRLPPILRNRVGDLPRPRHASGMCSQDAICHPARFRPA